VATMFVLFMLVSSVIGCPLGKYPSENGACRSCITNCKTCQVDPDFCTSCYGGLALSTVSNICICEGGLCFEARVHNFGVKVEAIDMSADL